ncbi:MAG TPA: DUF6788 family protein [Solirubrobacteraceae bacterium]|nr:DUF6788 family protein [Solirubrobacteraceae bacterium]
MGLDQAQRERIREIAAELGALARSGKVLPGSIQERVTYCGRKGCACQGQPPRPHGPYWQWTRKVAGKTVTRRLSAEEVERYRPWFENNRRLRELIGELQALSLDGIERAEGQKARRRRSR